MVWSLQSVPALSDAQFALWSKLLEERAGIYLGEQKKVFLQTQVAMRMRELGYSDYGEYYQRVVDGVAGMVEWSLLVDRLVVNETSFFRHRPSIDFVGRHVAAHLQRVKAGDGSSAAFDLWSIGCSSGEEPYSLAMVMSDAYQNAGLEPRYAITGTDISRAALGVARAGIYGARKVQMVDDNYRQRYFLQVADNQYQISSLLRDRICFTHGNVLNINEMPVIQVDAIFCQNLLVYFRRWLREQILNAFVARLKPGGILVIGLGEVVDWTHPDMKRVAADGVQAYIHT
ncbi:protein-glutamate O-methyltransferase CheR [Saccharophagus sp. K07]|jgi:type IV pilus assembly protein PilK|uniref:CheR family methyltransferase n=1 Tax=Saccharophagus sp. K07 TaxID=2283636 RepID=UPI0016521CF5|nr:CheR family methyltransferase [Saccharophagus sp. K07]MBC6906025.1 protein-glutamate O-methyltransferase CheR [Saccharophagus sp. K07]